jgi:hypothetical protein
MATREVSSTGGIQGKRGLFLKELEHPCEGRHADESTVHSLRISFRGRSEGS